MSLDIESSSSNFRYVENGGEMGKRVRSFDWSKTQLGPIDDWSQSLLTTINIMLGSKSPMFLWWGTECIQFYNDAYRPNLENEEKHPKALGQRGAACWPEDWSHLKPMIDSVMGGAETTWQENVQKPLYVNAHIENVLRNFSYSRVIDGDRGIGGVLVIGLETNNSVNAQQPIDQSPTDLLSPTEANLNNLITQAPVAIGLLKGRNLLIETANKKLLQLWGKSELVIGKRLEIAMPELEGQPFFGILDEVYTSGMAYSNSEVSAMVEKNGTLKEYYFDFLYQPIKDDQGKTESIFVIAKDSTEQVNARKIVEQSDLQFRQLADSITQMVWITDANGMHEYYNKRWYDFTGSDLAHTKGEGWNQMFHPEDRQRAFEKWNFSLKTGNPYEIEYRLKNQNGDYVWVLGRAAAFYDSDGKISKWFGTCTDIHDQKLLLQEKDDFISIASHELKTPLTSLRAFLQLIHKIKDDSVSSKLSGLIERASHSADKIYRLVEDLLDVGKLNHGKLTLNKTMFNLAELISNSCDHLTIEAIYSINIVGSIDLQVYADADRVEQVISNFVSNAIKYAPNCKEILVAIETSIETVKISVTDKGQGIGADKIPHLFDRYYRIDATSHKAGLGLGLYICSEIINQHGGKIGVESEIGVGSSFWFTLPLI